MQNNGMRKKFLCLLLIFSTLFLSGCFAKEISSAEIMRDEAKVGGSLSFVYNQKDRCVYIGGEGEFVEFYKGDLSLSEGNRVGLKVIAPNEVEDFEKVTVEMSGESYSDLFQVVSGQKQNYFYIYPAFSEENREVKMKINWADDIESQEYKIIILSGTKFLNINGEVI